MSSFRSATVNLPNLQLPSTSPPTSAFPIVITHISDTHNKNSYELPKPPRFEGSVLIHTGDWTNRGTVQEHQNFGAWVKTLQKDFQFILLLNGNHDARVFADSNGNPVRDSNPSVEILTAMILSTCKLLAPQNQDEDLLLTHPKGGCMFLHDRRVIIGGVKFYGTPWGISGPAFCLWDKDQERASMYSRIPADTHVLVTHNPPWLIADVAWVRHKTESGPCKFCGERHPNYEHWGDWEILEAMRRVRVPVFLCGHVHDDAGLKVNKINIKHDDKNSPTFDCLVSNGAMDLAKRCNRISIPRPIQNPQQQAQEQIQQQEQNMQNKTGQGVAAGAKFDEEVPPPALDESMASTSTSSDFSVSESSQIDESPKQKQQQQTQTQPQTQRDAAFNFFLERIACHNSNNSDDKSIQLQQQQQQRFLQLSSSSRLGLALDRDWWDKNMETVMLWRRRSRRPVNQLWRFDLLNSNPIPLFQGKFLALHTRISCLIPKAENKNNNNVAAVSKNKDQEFEMGFLRSFFYTLSSKFGSNSLNEETGVKVLSPSRIAAEQQQQLYQERIAAMEPFTRWYVVPIPGSLTTNNNNNNSTVEVMLLFQNLQRGSEDSFYVLRANDINQDGENDDDDKNDMKKTELDLVKFSANVTAIPDTDKWIVCL